MNFFSTSELQHEQNLLRLPENHLGQDWFVGDIHGCFDQLDTALNACHFDPSKDRLFAVGDLIDRGPHSNQVLHWLEKPWFYSVMGNHERMLLDAVNSEHKKFWWYSQGGEWWENTNETFRRECISKLEALPIAIEIGDQSPRVGIVHAEVPRKMSWQQFALKITKANKAALTASLWGRHRIRRHESNTSDTDERVEGIEMLVVGHTPQPFPRQIGNIFYIDTGAVYGHKLIVCPLTQLYRQQSA